MFLCIFHYNMPVCLILFAFRVILHNQRRKLSAQCCDFERCGKHTQWAKQLVRGSAHAAHLCETSRANQIVVQPKDRIYSSNAGQLAMEPRAAGSILSALQITWELLSAAHFATLRGSISLLIHIHNEFFAPQ